MHTYTVRMTFVAEVVAPNKEVAEQTVRENLGEEWIHHLEIFNIDLQPRPVVRQELTFDTKTVPSRRRE